MRRGTLCLMMMLDKINSREGPLLVLHFTWLLKCLTKIGRGHLLTCGLSDVSFTRWESAKCLLMANLTMKCSRKLRSVNWTSPTIWNQKLSILLTSFCTWIQLKDWVLARRAPQTITKLLRSILTSKESISKHCRRPHHLSQLKGTTNFSANNKKSSTVAPSMKYLKMGTSMKWTTTFSWSKTRRKSKRINRRSLCSQSSKGSQTFSGRPPVWTWFYNLSLTRGYGSNPRWRATKRKETIKKTSCCTVIWK